MVTHLHIWHYPAGQISHQSPLGQLVEDDHRHAEEQHHEVPERQAGQRAVPGVLQVIVVPHDTHERQITHNAHGEHDEREQHDGVRAVRLLREREQRVVDAQRAVERSRRGEERVGMRSRSSVRVPLELRLVFGAARNSRRARVVFFIIIITTAMRCGGVQLQR